MENEQVKPIFIVRLTEYFDYEEHEKIQKKLSEKLIGYHILVFSDITASTVEFECYNTRDVDTKSFEELKELVNNIKHEQRS